MTTAAGVSERGACLLTGFARSTRRYQRTRDDTKLLAQLETLAMPRPRWGDRRLHWFLERDGTRVIRQRVQRVYLQRAAPRPMPQPNLGCEPAVTEMRDARIRRSTLA